MNYTSLYTVTDIFGFQLLSQTFEIFFTTPHNIFHQDFYPSWEIFTRAALAPLCIFTGAPTVIGSADNKVLVRCQL